MDENFRQKICEAMIGHKMGDIVDELSAALSVVLAEADPSVRQRLIEIVCVKIAEEATRLGDKQ